MQTRMRPPPSATGPRWLIRRGHRPQASANLYCFAHAGGSPGEYARWSDDLPGMQVWAVQPPGRGSRLAEDPYTRMRPLVQAIVDEAVFTPPFALFGHSLGGLVAFEVARALRDRGQEPERLFLSSCPPPPTARTGRSIHALSDSDLLAEIGRRWGGLPANITANPRLRALVLTPLRADLEVFETYQYIAGHPLNCPIMVFAGEQERNQFPLDDWRAHTSGPFEVRFLPGHHFYLRQQRLGLLHLVAEAMADGPWQPSIRPNLHQIARVQQ